MDAAARAFIKYVRIDPWEAIDLDQPLPADHPAALLQLRAIVYALLQALDFTLDEATPIIGRLVEIMQPCRALPQLDPARDLGKAINPKRRRQLQPFRNRVTPGAWCRSRCCGFGGQVKSRTSASKDRYGKI